MSQEQVILLVVLGLVVVFGVTLHGFLTVGNLLLMGRSVSVLGILGLGMGIVVIARGLDLSLVATMAISGAVTLQALNHPNIGAPEAVLLGLAICIGMGLLNSLIISFVEVPALFVTLATGLGLFGLARTVFLGGNLIIDSPNRAGFIRSLGTGHVLGIPTPLVIFGVACLVTHLVLTRTLLGRFVYAHGDNPEAAALTGIPVRPLTTVEYLVCALFGYLAGLVTVGEVSGMDTQVITSSLIYNVLTVVVVGGISLVGGRGGVLSVIAGTLLIGVMLNGMTLLNMDVYMQEVVQGLILLTALILDNRLHPRDEETVKQGD